MSLHSNGSFGATPTIPGEISGTDLVSNKEMTIRFSESKIATVVVFLSARCPCSASHQPALNQLAAKYEKDGIRFVGINSNQNEPLKEVTAYFKNSGLTFPVIRDSLKKNLNLYANQFEALKTPHAFVVKDGKIVFSGGVDNSKLVERASEYYLKDTLEAIIHGENPPQKTVRVLGCFIKREE